jgi:hypothetical protein
MPPGFGQSVVVYNDKTRQVIEWATKHETVIILHAGDNKSMAQFRGLLESNDNPYPHSAFKEEGLGNALTSLCIILPEKMYDLEKTKKVVEMQKQVDKYLLAIEYSSLPERTTEEDKLYLEYTEWERKFLVFKSKCRFAT